MSNSRSHKRVHSRLVALLWIIGVLAATWSACTTPATAATTSIEPVPGQFYQVVAKHNGECLMTRSWVNADKIVTRPCQGRSYMYQWWKFVPVPGTASYRLVNDYNGMCLDVAWASEADWADVVQAQCIGGANQFWQQRDTSDGYFELVVQHTMKCLDISWGWAVQFGCTDNFNERFKLR